MKKTVFLIVSIIVLLAYGCKEKANLLTLNEWQLKEMKADNQEVKLPSEMPTLCFTDTTTVFGFAGCNRFFGTYSVGQKGKISIKPVGSTMAFCPEMNFEQDFLRILPELQVYTTDNNQLVLSDEARKYILTFIPKDTTRLIGVANDAHGCNQAAGYTWSEVKQNCIRIFEDGVKMESVTDTASTLATYIVFSPDSLKVEVFLPETEIHPVLDRRLLPGAGYTWNVEDDDTLNVRVSDGEWVIEQRGNQLCKQVKDTQE